LHKLASDKDIYYRVLGARLPVLEIPLQYISFDSISPAETINRTVAKKFVLTNQEWR